MKNMGASSFKNLDSPKNPGPFQIVWSKSDSLRSSPSHNNTSNVAEKNTHPNPAPIRNYECKNYQSCLELAAALNWDSFTCENCTEEIDDKLVWKAHLAQRSDKIAKRICELPDIQFIENTVPKNTEKKVTENSPPAENTAGITILNLKHPKLSQG